MKDTIFFNQMFLYYVEIHKDRTVKGSIIAANKQLYCTKGNTSLKHCKVNCLWITFLI